MHKISKFCTKNDHLHAFYAPTKIVQIGWGHHVYFCVWEKSAITFGEGCMNTDSDFTGYLANRIVQFYQCMQFMLMVFRK